ncbi:Hsp70 family protein [Pelagibacterium sp.]|uniref:Hsp70 family protein n=1 Tax=Pelagibacterium sp. TaxID=1967288 RepID=UPI003A9510E1
MSSLHCGVDFGTTNSTIGLVQSDGTPVLIPVEGNDVTLPSALFFSFEDHSTHFGRSAVHEYMDGAEGRFMRALKSILGTSLMDETTQIGRERTSFEGLIGRFLKHLRERLIAHTGAMPEQVVLGRPVFFVDGDTRADRAAQDQLEAAARAQGFKHIEFQFEPVAAALHFERTLDSESLALVVDIGGGTSDFSVLRLSPERKNSTDRRNDILSTAGVHVGGTDFDRQLNIAKVMPEMGRGTSTRDGKRQLPVWYFHDMATWHKINQLYRPEILRDIKSLQREAAEPEKLERFKHLLANRSGHRLAGQVEKAKIALTDAAETEIELIEPGLSLAIATTRAEFEASSAALTTKIGAAMDEALTAAGVGADAIETVILTGGGAQVRQVRALVDSRFGHARIAQSDQFGAVGLGLAVDAARRFG